MLENMDNTADTIAVVKEGFDPDIQAFDPAVVQLARWVKPVG